MSALIFVTGNEHKFAEASAIVSDMGIALVQSNIRIMEIQTAEIATIVDRKAKDSYARLGRPLFVEHTSLHLHFANGFPGGLTQPFLEKLGDDRVCDLFGDAGKNAAYGQTTIGYCDGRRVHQFVGRLDGRIPSKPVGPESGWEKFGWSRIFVPEGYSKTLSELGMDEKNKFSMRRIALLELSEHLSGHR